MVKEILSAMSLNVFFKGQNLNCWGLEIWCLGGSQDFKLCNKIRPQLDSMTVKTDSFLDKQRSLI